MVSVVLKLLKSIVWLSSYGAGLLVRIGDILASEGMRSLLIILGEGGGGACGRHFRSWGVWGGPSTVRLECFLLPAP